MKKIIILLVSLILPFQVIAEELPLEIDDYAYIPSNSDPVAITTFVILLSVSIILLVSKISIQKKKGYLKTG